MFDIGFPELLLVSVITLLVLGPERLPEALRSLGLWLGRARRSFTRVKTEIEREIGMDEVRRQLHNEAIMEQMKEIQQDVDAFSQDIRGVSPPASPASPASQGPSADETVEPVAPAEPAPELPPEPAPEIPPETPGPASTATADER